MSFLLNTLPLLINFRGSFRIWKNIGFNSGLMQFWDDDLLVGVIFVLRFGIRGADLGNWALNLKSGSLYLATLSTPQVRCYFRLLLAPSWFHSASFAQKFFWIKGVDNQKGGLIVLKNHESRIFCTDNVKIKSGLGCSEALWRWIAQNSHSGYNTKWHPLAPREPISTQGGFHERGVPPSLTNPCYVHWVLPRA